MSFDVILYFFADDGYEIRVQLEGYPSYRVAAKFLVDSYELQFRYGGELSLVDSHGPIPIPSSGIKVFLFRQRAEARRLLDTGRKSLFEDHDYELVDIPLREWHAHPALARRAWSVGGARIINSKTKQEHYRCIPVLVRTKDGRSVRPATRAALEAALGGKAIADVDICPNVATDSDWLPGDCLCVLDPGATARNTGFECDPNPSDPTVSLFFYPSTTKRSM